MPQKAWPPSYHVLTPAIIKTPRFTGRLTRITSQPGIPGRQYSRVGYGDPNITCSLRVSRMKTHGKPNLLIPTAPYPLPGERRDQLQPNFLFALAINRDLTTAGR